MSGLRPTWVEVDVEAIRHNVRTLKPEEAELMAVVKADAYGHGDVAVARAALEAGATWIGVALVEEGLRLRDAGIEAPILVLSEFPPGSEPAAIAPGLTPSLYSDAALERLSEAAIGREIGVHVKVDTGMHRAGVYPPEATRAFVDRVASHGLGLEALWTHYASSSEDEKTTLVQLECFLAVVEEVRAAGHAPTLLHTANSGATILYPETHLDLVRTGIAMYGLEPAPDVADGLGLRPALTWRSTVAMTKRLPAGERVSYGHRYRLERAANVATVPVGYADGYPRILSSRADVLIRGHRCRVAGSVTMDQLIVDCGDVPVEPGDDVVLLGRQGEETVTAEELARQAETIGYEIVTGIGARVPREHTS
ncbi:MAG: alanine racemase [Actinomycetota bacterium]